MQEPATSLAFAEAARRLAAESRRLGLVAPAFRSPPRLAGADRSLTRRRGAAPTVSVRIRGRPAVAVVADMIDGVVAANLLRGRRAQQVRTALWRSADPGAEPADAGARSAA